jgi:hypothetical protein
MRPPSQIRLIGPIFDRFSKLATERFTRLSVDQPDKPHSVLCFGYVDHNDDPRAVAFLVSNFERWDRRERNDEICNRWREPRGGS